MAERDRNNVTERQQTRKVMRSSTLVSLLGVGLFLGGGFLLYKLAPSPTEKLQQKQAAIVDAKISLEIVQQSGNKPWQPLSGPLIAGMQIGFRLSTNQPIHASLFKQIDNGTPQQLFDDIRIPPGASKVINFDSSDYRYTISKRDGAAKFCLISAADSAALQIKLNRLTGEKELDHVAGGACTSLPPH